MIDRDESDNQLRRWQQADDHRDQLQAQLDRFEAFENAGLAGDDADAERERLDEAIIAADQECFEAEIAFHRSVGDDAEADRLESDRIHRDLIAAVAAQAIMDEMRRAHGEDDPPDLDA